MTRSVAALCTPFVPSPWREKARMRGTTGTAVVLVSEELLETLPFM